MWIFSLLMFPLVHGYLTQQHWISFAWMRGGQCTNRNQVQNPDHYVLLTTIADFKLYLQLYQHHKCNFTFFLLHDLFCFPSSCIFSSFWLFRHGLSLCWQWSFDWHISVVLVNISHSRPNIPHSRRKLRVWVTLHKVSVQSLKIHTDQKAGFGLWTTQN